MNRLRERYGLFGGGGQGWGMEPQALHTLTKYSASKPHPQGYKGLVMSVPVVEPQLEPLFVSVSCTGNFPTSSSISPAVREPLLHLRNVTE